MSRYIVQVRECRWGFEGVVLLGPVEHVEHANGLWEPQYTLVEPPTYWRPTAVWARRRAFRKAAAWHLRDQSEDRMVSFDVPAPKVYDGPVHDFDG